MFFSFYESGSCTPTEGPETSTLETIYSGQIYINNLVDNTKLPSTEMLRGEVLNRYVCHIYFKINSLNY